MTQYQIRSLEITNRKITRLVKQNNIKGLAQLAAHLQADMIDREDIINCLKDVMSECLKGEDMIAIFKTAVDKHMHENPNFAKLIGKEAEVPEEKRKLWEEVSRFVNAWSVEREEQEQ